jgi:hypothetical protein
VILTGTSTGKGPPRYDWGEQIEPEVRLAYGAYLEEFYREGLYGTGSPGQVRDMLHAMHRLSDLHRAFVQVRVPEATQRKAEQEAKADAAELPKGAVW